MTIHLELVSDVVCPWCWLGLRRVVAAIDALDDPSSVELRFRPFQLDPFVPFEGVPYKDYMKSKFGGDVDGGAKDKWATMRAMLEAYGEEENIPFRFDNIPMRPNTLNAHRIIRWAQGQGLGAKAKELIFKAYFEDHEDIGDPNVLIRLAEEAGLHSDVVSKLLSEGADIESLREEEQFFRDIGINGVPVLIADRKFALQGAESVEAITSLIQKAQEASAQAS